MPAIPIARIIEDAGPAYDRIRAYVIDRFVVELGSKYTDLHVDALIEGSGLDIVVRVFITIEAALADGRQLAQKVREDLDASGYQALIYIQTWSGNGLFPSD